ncbi:MAG: lysine--tRNA ligase [Verrucomicrobiales bacterium]|nr:lysine--tRNA ligase [Verrucomicrobiales bacterium]
MTQAHSTLEEIRRIRIEKATELQKLGISAYPSKSARDAYAGPILAEYEAHEGKTVTVGGRIMSFRKQGGMAFAHIQDQTGKIQLLIRRETLGETRPADAAIGFTELRLLDVGDIVEGTGKVMKSMRGEISIEVVTLRLLTKTIRPLPDQWHGLKDRESILRKRYLDTIMDPESHRRYASVAKMIAGIREFLNARGFIEFQTPIIQAQYGGGTAKPFRTHVNALSTDMYLAISHELYLKRLIVAGYDKVYTIGRYFRNEGIDRSHHPEFSMVETMAAYENYEYNMDLVEEMFRHLAVNVFGRTEFKVKDQTIDFGPAWRRVRMVDVVNEVTGVDFGAMTTLDEAQAALKKLDVHEHAESIGHALVLAFEHFGEKTLIQPTLVYGQPVEISPLAKPLESDPRWAERFEIYIAGMECGDNWSEQNDPVQLLETWRKAYKVGEEDSGVFHALDFDFIEALEHGMPPTTGIGPGIERMAMIFTEQENIDDVIFFPMMRPAMSNVNAEIFGVDISAAKAPQKE